MAHNEFGSGSAKSSQNQWGRNGGGLDPSGEWNKGAACIGDRKGCGHWRGEMCAEVERRHDARFNGLAQVVRSKRTGGNKVSIYRAGT